MASNTNSLGKIRKLSALYWSEDSEENYSFNQKKIREYISGFVGEIDKDIVDTVCKEFYDSEMQEFDGYFVGYVYALIDLKMYFEEKYVADNLEMYQFNNMAYAYHVLMTCHRSYLVTAIAIELMPRLMYMIKNMPESNHPLHAPLLGMAKDILKVYEYYCWNPLTSTDFRNIRKIRFQKKHYEQGVEYFSTMGMAYDLMQQFKKIGNT